MDPSPLTLRQLGALLAVLARELIWIVPGVSREIAAWRELAHTIPSPTMRTYALRTLEEAGGRAEHKQPRGTAR